ncbi:MAG TPA: ATP-binding protein [Pyrinomonadaceae bacterium]|nr:ATP-binding protein [Pyrinomonadaceae bacterium]
MRVQLTLWYTGVLALTLIVFAVSLYFYLARATRHRTDDALLDTANSFVSNFNIEFGEEKHTAGEAANEATRSIRFRDQQVIVYDQQGRMVVASNTPEGLSQGNDWFTLPPANVELGKLLNSVPSSSHPYETLFSGDQAIRIIALRMPAGPETYTLLIATPLRNQEQALESARQAFAVAIAVALLIAGLSGHFLARKSLRPIVIMGKQAARIGASNLNERMPVPINNQELGGLAVAFNDLLARLDESFAQQRRFMADASHELRTPVAVVCGESEVALSQPTRAASEYRESLGIVNDEGLRMRRLVEDLFTLARADTGEYPISLADFYLDESVNECVRSVRSLATQSDLEISYQPPAREIELRGDEPLVQRMIFNLLHNAIKYTPKGGRVCIRIKESERQCEITISDTGPGIPREAQAHIFDRFFRVDKARSRDQTLNGSGAGLGLSIAKWVAELHGGTIILESPNGNGATFVISLPKQPH